jgi:hypothetical protein
MHEYWPASRAGASAAPVSHGAVISGHGAVTSIGMGLPSLADGPPSGDLEEFSLGVQGRAVSVARSFARAQVRASKKGLDAAMLIECLF